MERQDDDPTTAAWPSASSIHALVGAVCRLTDDPEWLIAALTEMLTAMRPPVPPTEAEVDYLLSSSAFTPTQLSRIRGRVAHGSLALEGAKSFLSALYATWSLEQVVSYMGSSRNEVLAAVEDGQLYAAKIGQSFRFPVFQFNIGRPEPLLPHLPEFIEAVHDRWNWISAAAFMETPQATLLSVSKLTPRAWLLDGGSFEDIKQITNSTRWR
ncbi:hypothetical protein ACIPV2_00475 [Microbacterium sp. NPDC089987]|uniref:hypothetical protein n=1 Tax=Microbacterium sp. NPDC089987 TaxID=3364202 RepID=UPI0038295E26